jgi:hypothetical protein
MFWSLVQGVIPNRRPENAMPLSSYFAKKPKFLDGGKMDLLCRLIIP